MDIDINFISLCSLSDDLLHKILGYLDPMWVCGLMGDVKDKWLRHKLYMLVYMKTFVDYGRIVVHSDVHRRVIFIQQKENLSVKPNSCGYRIGQQVRILYDSRNSFWSHYRPSRYVRKVGYIVGCTEQYVHVAVGNLWNDEVDILRKKNGNVARVVPQ